MKSTNCPGSGQDAARVHKADPSLGPRFLGKLYGTCAEGCPVGVYRRGERFLARVHEPRPRP